MRQSIAELRSLVAAQEGGKARGAVVTRRAEAGTARKTLPPGPGYRRSGTDPRPRAGVGMLGYGFMGKAHSNALRTLTYIGLARRAAPRAGRRCRQGPQERVADAAVRYGFDGYYTDWHGLVEDERISVFDNAAADPAHVEPTLAAIAASKHVVCEKPLARSAADALGMWAAAERAAVKHLCCYNYRFVPAVRLARDMLRGGSLGAIYQARFRYSQGWSSLSPDGSLVTIGCHAIDQARFLVGEITSVSALFSDPLSSARDKADHEPPAPGDVVTALVRFASGATGTIDASGYCRSRRNMLAWEINCEQGTLALGFGEIERTAGECTEQCRDSLVNGFGGRDCLRAGPSVYGSVVAEWPPAWVGARPHEHVRSFLSVHRRGPCRGAGRGHLRGRLPSGTHQRGHGRIGFVRSKGRDHAGVGRLGPLRPLRDALASPLRRRRCARSLPGPI